MIIEKHSKSRIERKKAKTKEVIVSLAIKLFMDQGFDSTTMEQIAHEADIAKGTLYNYFPVKEAILDEFIQHSFREKNPEMLQRIRQLPHSRSRMNLVLYTLMEGIIEQPLFFKEYIAYRIKNMIAMDRAEREKSGIGPVVMEIIRWGQTNGEIRNDLPLNLLTDFFEFIFIQVAQAFYSDPNSFQIEKTVAQYIDLFFQGTVQKAKPELLP